MYDRGAGRSVIEERQVRDFEEGLGVRVTQERTKGRLVVNGKYTEHNTLL